MRVLRAPLAAAAHDFQAAVSEEARSSSCTLEAWSSRAKASQHTHGLGYDTWHLQEAGGWVNGVLAWVTAELGTHLPAAQGSCSRRRIRLPVKTMPCILADMFCTSSGSEEASAMAVVVTTLGLSLHGCLLAYVSVAPGSGQWQQVVTDLRM